MRYKDRVVSIAPMMDWTDRHCRYFHRLLTQKTWLYTEMVTTGALRHSDVPRHLDYSVEEHPLALQLGGSEPNELAHSAQLGAQWGYDEINLNCGCPSERVQKGAFGACLMAEPALVADGVKAMRDVVDLPITVKHRIGIDAIESYDFVRDFVGVIAEAGCSTFIVHTRNAILKGLTPRENREIPPLKYDYAYQLKTDFPHLEILLNGGVSQIEQVQAHLLHVDGVMIGREAYHNPWLLTQIDAACYGSAPNTITRAEVVTLMARYAAQKVAEGHFLGAITRHMLGLYHGQIGARAWRRTLSDHKLLAGAKTPAAVHNLFNTAQNFVEVTENP